MRQADIGRAFRLVRVWREMSQLQLAVRAGVTQGLISSIERGHHDPEPVTFAKIVKALDFTEQKIMDLAWELEMRTWVP